MTRRLGTRIFGPILASLVGFAVVPLSPALASAPGHASVRDACSVGVIGTLWIDGHSFRIRPRGVHAQLAGAFRRCGYDASVRGGCVRVAARGCDPYTRWDGKRHIFESRRERGVSSYHVRSRTCGARGGFARPYRAVRGAGRHVGPRWVERSRRWQDRGRPKRRRGCR